MSATTVTLTAGGDIPPGATYQWQVWSGTIWTDLGTASTTATKDVSSTTRGTKKYQVVVSYRKTSSAASELISATSQPVHVTWDEVTIVGSLFRALGTAVSKHATYTEAETALRTCINAGLEEDEQFESFDEMLENITGETKTKMDGVCKSQTDTMFNSIQTLSRAQLLSYRTATSADFNAQYAAWLETPRGAAFEANPADPTTARFHAYFMASGTSSPGQLLPPYYDTSGSDGQPSGQAGLPSPPSAPSLAQATELGCLPSQVQGEYLTLANKLRVLNCLVFATPHSFWVADANGVRGADALKEEGVPEADRKWDWLGFGDWKCTFPAVNGPVPSCLKHDVMYSALQKFAGANPGTADGDELDATWNPRGTRHWPTPSSRRISRGTAARTRGEKQG